MFCRVLLVCALFGAAPVSAHAGAFLQPPEHGQIISQLSFSEAGRAWDAYGRAVPIPAWRKFELTSYAEYGLTDWLTIIGSPSWFRFHAPAPRPSNWFGPVGSQDLSRVGAAQTGARVRLFEIGDHVVSVQASARYAGGGGDSVAYADMSRRMQVDLRIAYGRKFEWMGLSGYTDMQVAFRSAGVFGNQIRFDATLAVQPFARTTLMLQSFSVLTPGRLGGSYALSQKLQTSVLLDVTETVALQAGALVALRGVRSAAERGLVTGVWYRF
ncbi:MAG: hypothetical protein U1E28_11320 [Beijerinckiaceae bacterium]